MIEELVSLLEQERDGENEKMYCLDNIDTTETCVAPVVTCAAGAVTDARTSTCSDSGCPAPAVTRAVLMPLLTCG